VKKKVLPPFYQKYTASEQSLISACKNHFVPLKATGSPIIPFAFLVDSQDAIIKINPGVLQENTDQSYIEQFKAHGLEQINTGLAKCFAVCYDAHVFDADEIDQDALVLMLQMEAGSTIQINVPYVQSNEKMVFGEAWVYVTNSLF